MHTLAVLISRSANDETGKLGTCVFVKCVIAVLNMAILVIMSMKKRSVLIQP